MRIRKEVMVFVLILAVLMHNVGLAASIKGRLIDQISKKPVGTMGWLDLYMYKEEYHYPWAHIASARPDSEGNFSFLDLEGGTYVIHGECSGYHPEWYDDVQGSKGAPLIIVKASIEKATHIVLGLTDERAITVDLLPKVKSLVEERLPEDIGSKVHRKSRLNIVIRLPGAPKAPLFLPSTSPRLLPAAPLVRIEGEGILLEKYVDKDSKAGFELFPGRYRIEVTGSGYKKWTKENFIKEDRVQDFIVELTPAELQPEGSGPIRDRK